MTDDETVDAILALERSGEAAFAAMYEARPAMAKTHYEDARSHFAMAIEMAIRAGRHDEVARLTARRDHILNVYDHQFRYVG